jgi:hypothetical protein
MGGYGRVLSFGARIGHCHHDIVLTQRLRILVGARLHMLYLTTERTH